MRLIAHRGASASLPENTLPAFEAAVAARAEAIEFDARLTADGAVVIMHDDDVSSTTDGTGRISQLTLSEVRRLNAGIKHASEATVPALEEVLAALAGRIPLVVELKGALSESGYLSAVRVAEAAAPMLREVPGLVVSSFEPEATAAMRALVPGVATAITSGHGVDPMWALDIARAVGHVECHIPVGMADESFVSAAHAAGVAVVCWTVNEPSVLDAMSAIGVDGVFTDDPARLRASLT
jgi:glycerophosphoryl diester phosphodiesterase